MPAIQDLNQINTYEYKAHAQGKTGWKLLQEHTTQINLHKDRTFQLLASRENFALWQAP